MLARCRASCLPRSAEVPACAATGVAQRTRAHRPVTRAFRTDLRVGDRGTARAAVGPTRRLAQRLPFVSNAAREPTQGAQASAGSLTKASHGVSQSLPGRTTRNAPGRGVSEAAGQGLEPQLPEPESGVLPLDDPAGRDRLYPAPPGRPASRSRAGTRARAAFRPRCRCGRSPRRAARAPSPGASPSAARRPGRGRRSCS